MKIICIPLPAPLKASDSKAFSKYLKYSANTQDISTMEAALLVSSYVNNFYLTFVLISIPLH